MNFLVPFEKQQEICSPQRIGTVIAVQANFYQVRLDSEGDQGYLLCTRRTRLKKMGQTIMVGDRVFVATSDDTDERGVVVEVLPRKTEFQRPPVANADQILLLFALEEPSLDTWQLSRFLLKAEATELGLCFCLNKTDLISSSQQQQWQQRLQAWGYDPVFISVASNQGLDQLLSRLRDRITIFAGPSGVGKSSLINQLIPQSQQRVAKISGKLQKGRHTTRHVELFDLPGGGLLADTPGFNQPDLDCSPTDLAGYFPEARQRLEANKCQFNDCLHSEEPNCAVRGDWERYDYYLKFLGEAIARQETLQQTRDAESSVKLKIGGAGQRHYEPKLESKKYRRLSRRSQQQTLPEVSQDEDE